MWSVIFVMVDRIRLCWLVVMKFCDRLWCLGGSWWLLRLCASMLFFFETFVDDVGLVIV